MDHGKAKRAAPAPPPIAARQSAKRELVRHLLDRRVPEKDEILQAKALAQALAGPSDAGGTNGFVACYLDLYLGRITGDAAVEADALRACLAWIERQDRKAGPGADR